MISLEKDRTALLVMDFQSDILAMLGEKAAERYEFVKDDICYCAMPLFHGNATMGVWAPAVHVGATMALARQ